MHSIAEKVARDTAFALEHGEDDLPFRFRLWFGRVFDFARAISTFAASTVASKKRKFDRELAGASMRPDIMRPGPKAPGQDRAGPRSAADVLRLSGRGRRHQQYV